MSDEARHVAFGVLSLKEFYDGLTEAEMLERQEFAFEAAVRMRDRFLQQEVWERMGVDVKEAIKVFDVPAEVKNQDPFQQLLFSKIVPNCKKLGLLDANDGWLRKRFDTLGVTQFEDWVDTGEEYARPRRGRQGPRSRRLPGRVRPGQLTTGSRLPSTPPGPRAGPGARPRRPRGRRPRPGRPGGW